MIRILSFLVVLLSLTSGAATYYVDKAASGSANGTSWADAWTALSNAVYTTGDTIYVRGGNYSEHFDVVNKSGVTIAADPASTNQAVFLGSQIYNADGSVIDGRSAAGYGFKTTATCSFGQHAMFVRESSNTVIRGFEITRETDYASDTKAHHLISLGTGANYGIQILDSYLHHSSADGVNANFNVPAGSDYAVTVISNTVISHVGDDGVQIANRRATIANCRITSDIPAMFGGHPDGVQLNPDGGNLKVVATYFQGFNQNIFVEYGASNILIWNNVIVGDPTHTNGTDRAMSISARTNTWSGSFVVANNTLSGFLTASAINDATTLIGLPGLTFANNICTDSRWFMASASQSLLDDSNLYYHSGAQFYDSDGNPVSAPADPFDGSSLNSDPLFVNLAGGDYRLQTGSPARGAGTNLTALGFTTDIAGTTRGTSWDMGAYQSSSGTPSRVINATRAVIQTLTQ
jgi:hypothetical protein